MTKINSVPIRCSHCHELSGHQVFYRVSVAFDIRDGFSSPVPLCDTCLRKLRAGVAQHNQNQIRHTAVHIVAPATKACRRRR